MGNVLANFLRNTLHFTWTWNFCTIGIIVGVCGILNLLFLIDNPAKVDIIIDKPNLDNQNSAEFDNESILIHKVVNGRHKKYIISSKSMFKTKKDITELEDLSKKEPLLISSSKNIDISNLNKTIENNRKAGDKETSLISESAKGISFWSAWLIRGVIPFALCISFVKFSTYGVLYWLPTYAREKLDYTNQEAGLLAISYDVGVVIGSIALGMCSDMVYSKRSLIALPSLVLGSITFFNVTSLTTDTQVMGIVIIFIVGFCVGGVFNIIAATASTDMAKTVKDNSKALSTISGIMDGSGSFGAAIGSFVIGEIARRSWDAVFYSLSL